MVVPASGLLTDLSTVGVDRCRIIDSPAGPEHIQIDLDAKIQISPISGPANLKPHGISLLSGVDRFLGFPVTTVVYFDSEQMPFRARTP